jgi:hypothetical protein
MYDLLEIMKGGGDEEEMQMLDIDESAKLMYKY